VITFGPDGISGHADHEAISKATTIAFEMITEAGNGPRKLYYVTIPESVVADVGGGDVNGVMTRPDDEITTIIDTSRYLDTKIRALRSHSSQQDARWLADVFQQSAQSTGVSREFFYLAKPRKTTKETDIFE
jgi:LmbE family N-acetylglucosaminyl deacetylase